MSVGEGDPDYKPRLHGADRGEFLLSPPCMGISWVLLAWGLDPCGGRGQRRLCVWGRHSFGVCILAEGLAEVPVGGMRLVGGLLVSGGSVHVGVRGEPFQRPAVDHGGRLRQPGRWGL